VRLKRAADVTDGLQDGEAVDVVEAVSGDATLVQPTVTQNWSALDRGLIVTNPHAGVRMVRPATW
jgi:hypothetical protein